MTSWVSTILGRVTMQSTELPSSAFRHWPRPRMLAGTYTFLVAGSRVWVPALMTRPMPISDRGYWYQVRGNHYREHLAKQAVR